MITADPKSQIAQATISESTPSRSSWNLHHCIRSLDTEDNPGRAWREKVELRAYSIDEDTSHR